MKKFAVVILLIVSFSVPAVAPKRGKERLRELAVYPEMNVQAGFDLELSDPDLLLITENSSLPERIALQREQLKQLPDDVQKQIQLGRLLDRNGETNAARACFEKAIQHGRRKIDAQPKDGRALTDLGDALSELGKDDEAESAYRKGTLVSSNDWRCWAGLGRCLSERARSLLIPDTLRGKLDSSLSEMTDKILKSRPSAEALSKWSERRNEAAKCFDRAVVLGPKEPEVFLLRAEQRCASNWDACLVRQFRGEEKVAPASLVLSRFSPTALPDLRQAAQLSPRNYRLSGEAAFFEWSAFVWPHAEQDPSFKPTFDALPAISQQSIRAAVTRLENLAEDADKELAAGALETLAVLRMLIQLDTQAAGPDARRALALDPSRERARVVLLSVADDSGSPAEVTSICESHLKQKESAQNHLLLAKALVKQEKWDAAATNSLAAARLDTNNIAAPLMMVAISIARSSGTNFLSVARDNLIAANVLLERMPAGEDADERWRECKLNGAILSGLVDVPELARAIADQVLERLPDDETAKEILKALEQSGP